MPDKEKVNEVTKTANLWAYPTNAPYKHGVNPHRHEKPSVSALAIEETDGTAHGLIETEKTVGRKIIGLVPDRGKKTRYDDQKPAKNT